ncbi:MAG: hypothetical protein FWG17_02985 [Desulfovibrionaceae bacterium]|nr:hypothetical protein [Desulfovibrionaceae bacterium]
MKYNPPFGAQDPNASFVNIIPGLRKGSAVPAEAIEYTQREIVAVITESGLEPSNTDLAQLAQAIKILAMRYSGKKVGEFELSPFRADQLKPFHYFANGDRFALESPQGQELYKLSPEYKQDWGITVQEIGGVLTINKPTLFYDDGRGMFWRPSSSPGGNAVGDAIRPIPGQIYSGYGSTGSIQGSFRSASGAFVGSHPINYNLTRGSSAGDGWTTVNLDISQVVPTAEENLVLNIGLTPAIFLGV